MAMNLGFFHALYSIFEVARDPDLNLHPHREKMRDDALDAVLKSDPSNADEFRKAVSAHKDFWALFPSMNPVSEMTPSDLDTDQFLDPKDSDPHLSFPKLHQMAAEQRVKVNLYKADKNVLVGILANNPDACRAYLADKAELGHLRDASGWQPNEMIPDPTGTLVPAVPPQNKSVAILTNEAVERIQEVVSQELLFKLVINTTDKVALKQLLNAANQNELNAAMQALGFPNRALPPNAQVRIAHPLSSVSTKWLYDTASTRELAVRQAWAKDNVGGYIRSLSEDQVLGRKSALEGNWPEYRNSFVDPYKSDLSSEDLKASRGLLGARYLQISLSKSKKNLLSALNADATGNNSQLEAEINKIFVDGKQEYRIEAVASDSATIRKGLLQGLINNLPDNPTNLKILSQINATKNLAEFKTELGKLNITNVDWIEEGEWKEMQKWSHSKAVEMVQEQASSLPNSPDNQDILKKINTAKTIEEFRDELKKIGVDPVDWITREDKEDIQKLTRPHAFKMHLESAKFGAKFRPKLLSALDKLPQKKQEALLEKPEQLRHLLNAKDANAVRFYLGQDAQGVDAVVTENKRLAGLQQLRNVSIAKALANAGVTLDEPKIKALNRRIKDIDANDFKSVEDYRDLVDEISRECGIPIGDPNVYKAFGLNKDGDDYLEDAELEIVASIKNQHTYNEELYRAASFTDDPLKKELIYILLRIEKNDSPTFIDHVKVTKIHNHFNASASLSQFLEKIGKDTDPAIKALKTGIQNELPAILFNQLKIQSLAAPLHETNMDKFNKAIKQMDAQLESMTATRKSFSDIAVKLQFVDDVEPIHLAAPQFVRECKDDPDGMRAKFGAMADNCDAIVDRLLRNRSLLEAQLASLPKKVPLGVYYDDRFDDVEDLRDNLVEELENTKKNLETFQKYQRKLSDPDPTIGILKAIDKAISGKTNDYYTPAKFTTTIIKAGNSITTGPSTVNAPHAVRVRQNLAPASSPSSFLEKERLSPGDKCEYAIKYDDSTGGNFRAEGKFTESHDQLTSPAPSTMKNGKITKQQECTFVVEAPLKQTIPPPPAPIDKEKLTAGNVEMYMTMAVAILSRFDVNNPPSKTNPIPMEGTDADAMRHLWTALVIVGEKNSKNMRFGRDAIVVESGPFNPAKERGRLGFTGDSFYTKYKKDYGNIIDAKVSDARGMAQKRTDYKKAVEHVEKGTEKYKEVLNDIKAVDESVKAREEEGAAPETPSVGFKH